MKKIKGEDTEEPCRVSHHPPIAAAIMVLPTTPVTLAVLRAALLLVILPSGRINPTHLEIEVGFLAQLDCRCCGACAAYCYCTGAYGHNHEPDFLAFQVEPLSSTLS